MQQNTAVITITTYQGMIKISKYEDFTGKKPDISYFVPFYAQGVCHETRSQRELHGGATFTPKAKTCRMLGHSTLSNIKMNNTYKVLIDNAVYDRHDCYFKHYTEEPSLLNDDVNERHHEDYPIKEDENYDNIFGKHKHFLRILLISIISEKEDDMTIKSYIQGRRIQSQAGKTICAIPIPKTIT
jgi:hypothetical protein